MNHVPVLSSPTAEAVLHAVFALQRSVSIESSEEEIARAYLDAMRELYPRRSFAIRLLSMETRELRWVYATGRLLASARSALTITRESAERHAFVREGVDVIAEYLPLFAEGARGFDVPMLDGQRLSGVLAVEYPPGIEVLERDREDLLALGLQLGALLRSARLLRESNHLRDYLSTVFDHANAPVVVVAADGRVRFVNRAFLGALRLRREDTLGRPFASLLTEPDRVRFARVFDAALRAEASTNVELTLLRGAGDAARIALNTAGIVNSDGEIDSVIAIGRDLTEMRALEARVIQAEKLATLGQLAAGVVHELNNPLTSISVYGEYLLKKQERGQPTEPADVEKLRRIVQSAERILRFTRDLVTYARPSSGEARPVSLNEIVQQSLMFCEHVLSECGATVETSFAPTLPAILGVKSQLHQVFINLVTNACHAMPEGAGRIVVETHVDRDGRVTVAVRDNGSGIPHDHLSRVFEPFFSTKGEGKGTGLGLSIVRNIVEQHHGEIAVDSELGAGTTFTLRFARSNAAAE